jgi:hypothetical protein
LTLTKAAFPKPPVDWKQLAGITHVPGIDADEMPAPYEG